MAWSVAAAGTSAKKAVILRPLSDPAGSTRNRPRAGRGGGARENIQQAEMLNHPDRVCRCGHFRRSNSSPIHLDP
jgi:hypothetical protein